MKFNKFTVLHLFLSVAIALSVASCSKSSSTKGGSSATGWKVNDKKGGFQYNSKFKAQITPPGMVPVEGGTFTMGKVQDDVMHDWNNTPNQQHVQSFYMDETEVTNFMYTEYLFWLKKIFPPNEQNYKNIYTGALPDTLVWRNHLGYNETMTNNYLRHPAYSNYPVVGVNWIQAMEYAKWRTDRVNESVLEKEGYLKKDAKTVDVSADKLFSTETYINAPSKTYGGDDQLVYKGIRNKANGKAEEKNVYAQRSLGVILPEYRLPTEAEWEYAAASLVGNREYNLYKGQKKYPWSGQYTRSGNRKVKGDQLANFKQGKGDYGGIAGWSDDNADITAPVKSYPANDFGLYDMAGNVAEWVADVYRPMVDDEMSDFNYHRGNVYMKNKIGPDGLVELINPANIIYDTLSNGKIIARNFPGQIAQVPVNENETYLRQNFTRSDNRNFRDGDPQSMKDFRGKTEGKINDSERMYDAPIHKVGKDSIGNMLRAYDRKNTRTTLIDNSVRIFKGGSWRDRAYWLDPSTRRYFPQDMATDYIGFRCAMSKVGPKTKNKTPRGNPKK